ncbi:MAG TPA: histidine kinase [Acidimicrobiales bacterium]|nr:histidine kinase [Acidimicrobiales bacterium]
MVAEGALHDAGTDARSRRSAHWLVVVGFVIWSTGLGLWGVWGVGGLAANLAGGAALIIGLEQLARRSSGSSPTVRWLSVPVSISLILISQGVGQSDFVARVALVGIGTLGMVLVFLRILDERLAIERQLAERTLVDERRRLAGEVHDVVGHTLSASMLHTTAARLSVRSDPDAAIASLERAEQQGRRSMDDIRSVVHLLRDDSGDGPPTPSAGDLPELVEGVRAAGADVTYAASSDLDDLPAMTALTVYRVVQEGLTNAVRHGTGTIEVTVDVPGTRDHVDVRISNDRVAGAAPAPPGSGLTGKRERVTAIGGTLDVGAAPDGHRWVLSARIPT